MASLQKNSYKDKEEINMDNQGKLTLNQISFYKGKNGKYVLEQGYFNPLSPFAVDTRIIHEENGEEVKGGRDGLHYTYNASVSSVTYGCDAFKVSREKAIEGIKMYEADLSCG